jgi:hypothetical protein
LIIFPAVEIGVQQFLTGQKSPRSRMLWHMKTPSHALRRAMSLASHSKGSHGLDPSSRREL